MTPDNLIIPIPYAIRCLFFASLVLAAAMAAAAEDWPQFRGDPQLTGVASTALPAKLKVLWKFETADAIESSAAIRNNAVFFGCNDGTLHCVDLATGSALWAYKSEFAFKASPAAFEEKIFAGDTEGVFHAIEAKTGKLLWKYPTEAEILSSANFVGDSVLFGSYDSRLYCLAAADGKLRWKFQSESNIHATPSVSKDSGLITGCDGKLRVLNLTDGKEVRAVELGSQSGVSPCIRDSLTFTGTFAGKILGLDWQKGEKIWEYGDPDRTFPFLSSPAVAGDRVVIGGQDKRILCLDARSGKRLWVFEEAKGRVDSSPLIAGKDVFIGCHDGRLYRLDLETGEERWRFDTGAPITASPAASGGRLIIGTEDRILYCFGSGD